MNRRRSSVFTLALLCSFALLLAHGAKEICAQTFTVVHTFTGGSDGAQPYAGLVMDQAGNLYGTSTGYSSSTAGTVFKLAKRNGSWVFNTLYQFSGGADGAFPFGGVVFGPDGALYGTALSGGTLNDVCIYQYCGTVFNLRPPPTFCRSISCPWTETALYSFNGSNDGANPAASVIVDSAGNLYGTTEQGGTGCIPYGCGTVFKLTHSQGAWSESVLYPFAGVNDGATPLAGVVFDRAGNLFGTTWKGGMGGCGSSGCGTVFELSPSGGGWAEQLIHSFLGSDGADPWGTPIFDQNGNLYGTTGTGGPGPGGLAGEVFELKPSVGGWNFAVAYGFSGDGGPTYAGVTMDTAGNLYGTTQNDGAHDAGSVYKLTPTSNGWIYTDLHDFTGGNDGWEPVGNVLVDAAGHVYGTTSQGGADGHGVVWEITP